MKPFSAPLDDILFTLNHHANASQIDNWDGETVTEIAKHFASFAEAEIAPLDASGDEQGCMLTNGRVKMPDGFAALYQSYAEQGWPSLTAPLEYGGQGMGALTLAVTSEIFVGACHSLQMVTGLVSGAIRTLLKFGTIDQQARLIPKLASGEFLATMCLTESGAGSDLSKVSCRAIKVDDRWRIHGEKIFISGGDQDMSDGILHLVLARTSDDGVKGLSLFLCSDLNGKTDNTISVTRIEEKMGLHASPTCQLVFDGAEGELIGPQGEGLKAMFTMMNHARLDVALQGVAHAARAYDIARSYAQERTQGRKPDGSPATLDDHADVVRMIDEIDAQALGGRAIVHLAYVTMEAGNNPDLVEFLTPIAKVFCTNGGIHAAEISMQVLGGYGYLSEYRLEQTYRDARICGIYEGANGIHNKMVVERFIAGRNIMPADAFEAWLADCAKNDATGLGQTLKVWQNARKLVAGSTSPAVLAHDFMDLTIDTLLHAVWARFQQIADQNADPLRIHRLSAMQIMRIRALLSGKLMILTALANQKS